MANRVTPARITADVDPARERSVGEKPDGTPQAWLALPRAAEDCYRCPGEAHPISRAVHLSRLAACFAACRHCEHRHDAGELLKPQLAALNELRTDRPHELFQTNGLRGIFRNEINHATGIRLGEVFASLLWEGVYNYSYVTRATTPGQFVVPPAKAEEMYHPETFGRTGTDFVNVE